MALQRRKLTPGFVQKKISVANAHARVARNHSRRHSHKTPSEAASNARRTIRIPGSNVNMTSGGYKQLQSRGAFVLNKRNVFSLLGNCLEILRNFPRKHICERGNSYRYQLNRFTSVVGISRSAMPTSRLTNLFVVISLIVHLLQTSPVILGINPRDKTAMLVNKTIENGHTNFA